jgi:short-chain 2-methylacyl-CoA dehydrogenase
MARVTSMAEAAERTATAAVPWLSADEAVWRARVRDVAERVVRPRVRQMDVEARLAPELCRELFAAGLMGIEVPEPYGGAGRGLFDVVLTIEEVARVDPAVAVLVDVQNALVVSAVLRHGTGDQRRRHLPLLASGTVGAYALSEEDAGSDAFALATTARPDADGGFVLRGRKRWTTNAAEAGVFLGFARVEGQGLAAFLIRRDAAGVAVGEREEKLGIRATSTCDLVLDDVRVEREDVLGRPGQGDVLAVETLNIGKIGIAAQLVGLAQAALEAALDYAQRRRQFGQPIAAFQGVRFPLARLAAELEAARALLYSTTRLLAHGGDRGYPAERLRAAAMAKYVASEIAERAAAQAVETFGGIGFTTRCGVEKLYRDAKVGKIYEGTSNMQLRMIAATLLGGEEAAAARGEG